MTHPLPTPQENPNGLHRRYRISKADGSPCDPDAVYFVLRLDGNGEDAGHQRASRAAALAYADASPSHLAQLADELRAYVNNAEVIGLLSRMAASYDAMTAAVGEGATGVLSASDRQSLVAQCTRYKGEACQMIDRLRRVKL